MTNERINLPDILGRVVECGRRDGKNEVTLSCGHGQLVTLSGISDDAAKRFARALFMPVRIECEVQDE